jgi:hypothetical protein
MKVHQETFTKTLNLLRGPCVIGEMGGQLRRRNLFYSLRILETPYSQEDTQSPFGKAAEFFRLAENSGHRKLSFDLSSGRVNKSSDKN